MKPPPPVLVATVEKNATWRAFWRALGGAAAFFCVANTVGRRYGELVICSGPSMHPTIEDGDYVLAERMSIRHRTLRVGDIVGCLNPFDDRQLLCKRLAGMERDIVPPSELLPTGRVPLGHVYLLGDNSECSTDSRSMGPIPQGLIEVRLVLRVWPPSRAGWLSNHWWYEHPEELPYAPELP